MTRINVIPVEELSDQHLIAEYRELPRVLKQNININDAPETYKLGTGHVKWAKRHTKYVETRFFQLVKEMQYRGFQTKFTNIDNIHNDGINYQVTKSDIQINKLRIIEKLNKKPTFYRWTKRETPKWANNAIRHQSSCL